MPENTILIRGRKYKHLNGPTTMRHDVFTEAQMLKAGISRMELLPGEDAESFAQRILRTAYANTDVFLLLGCLMIPAEMEPLAWTEDLARETGNFLGNVVDPEDKLIVRSQVVSAIEGFIRAGLLNLTTSANVSLAKSAAQSGRTEA